MWRCDPPTRVVLAAVAGLAAAALGHPPLALGAIYRATGRLEPLDPAVQGYYATQGVHLELRASRLVELGRRGGIWGGVDRLHAAALHRLGADATPSPPRSLVAGVTLGDTGS